MIKLFQFPPYFGLPNSSPFCMKVETYLRMVKLPFEIVKIHNPRPAPKGKLPYIEDNGLIISDSVFILDYLKEKYGDPLDIHLNEYQKAQSFALSRMLEDHLYWVMLYNRWIDETNWSITKNAFFGKAKGFVRYVVPILYRKKLIKDLHAQGLGRHSKEEIYAFGIKDLEVLHTFLMQNTFLLDKEPVSIDASAYAFLANILEPPQSSPLKEYATSKKRFIDYCASMKERFYPTLT
jgi:glutathione S-transferase